MIKFLKDKTTYETILRYLLGIGMLPYGLTKILKTQFVVFPFHLWSMPLKDISGATLTWAFLGYSPWFTVLLGWLETIPAILLFFRKTRLLGALLLFPVMLNVFLINMALDLWPSTQKISAILLLMDIALLLFHYQMLQEFFLRIINPGILTSRKLVLEMSVNIVLLGTIIFLSVDKLKDYINQRNFLTGDWYNEKPDYWIVKEVVQKDERQRYTGADDQNYIRYYFQPYNAVYEFVPGSGQAFYKHYQLDEQNQVLTIYDHRDSTNATRGPYKRIDENTIEWNVRKGEKRLWLSRRNLE